MVSNIFYFHPYLGKIPILTNIFQLGWNHQLDGLWTPIFSISIGSIRSFFEVVTGVVPWLKIENGWGGKGRFWQKGMGGFPWENTSGLAFSSWCLYGCFLKWWVSPTNPWVFLLKMIILGCELGVPPFKETPIWNRTAVGTTNGFCHFSRGLLVGEGKKLSPTNT